ncbi:hypothetical protein FSP39_017588 [Pinctada imbricata]|uniref:Sulfotransferase domain-containing protein n=1 Tax=Pinctada imbricata TaxID=66713 RepID=A0AA88XSP7_PINIB|nr:hypothetical protein FSP39_017588 [Pinctada imbricata]
MSVKYSPVPTNDAGELPQGWCRSQLHPNCTKRNIIALVVILSLSSVFIISACVGTSWIQNSHFCPEKPKVIPLPHSRKKGLPHYPHTQRRLPDCIIIGVRKGGTRALINYLNLHPDIVTAPEEIHFFDDQQNYSKGLSWYRRQMPYTFSDKVIIEKTPNYFVDDKVPWRIHNFSSSVKLILIVRDPLYRAVSDYTQIRERRLGQGLEMEEFEELAFNGEEEVSVDNVRTQYPAINRSLYSYHLTKWLRYFSLSQIHIVDGDNMVRDPVQEIKKVENFLSLEHKIQKDWIVFDRTKGFHCVKPDNKRYRCLNKTKGRKHPRIDPDVRDILNDFFEPWNQQFFNLTGRTFRWPKEKWEKKRRRRKNS